MYAQNQLLWAVTRTVLWYSLLETLHIFCGTTKFFKTMVLKQELSGLFTDLLYYKTILFLYVYNLSTVYYFSLLQWYNIIIKMTDEIYLDLLWLIQLIFEFQNYFKELQSRGWIGPV